jgi:hypothetical protein
LLFTSFSGIFVPGIWGCLTNRMVEIQAENKPLEPDPGNAGVGKDCFSPHLLVLLLDMLP